MIAPPNPGSGDFNSIVVAWNGSFQAARALEYALPFLEQGEQGDPAGRRLQARRRRRLLSRPQSRPPRHQSDDRRDRSRRRVGPRPRPRAARLHPRQERRPAGDGRLWPRPGAELPRPGRRHRQGDLVLPRAAPAWRTDARAALLAAAFAVGARGAGVCRRPRGEQEGRDRLLREGPATRRTTRRPRSTSGRAISSTIPPRPMGRKASSGWSPS